MLSNPTSPTANHRASHALIGPSSGGEPQRKTDSGSAAALSPPSELALYQMATKTTAQRSLYPESLLTLPSTLIRLIDLYLNNRDIVHLLLTGRHMLKEVNKDFEPYLRPGVVSQSTSLIACFQSTVNRKPSALKMGELGEVMFQKCLAMKFPGLTEVDYCTVVLKKLELRLLDTGEFGRLKNIVAGVALALGGNTMPPAHLDRLLACILYSYRTSSHEQMGAAIQGLCLAFGCQHIKQGHLKSILGAILGSSKNSTDIQMRTMVLTLCSAFGSRRKLTPLHQAALTQILDSHATTSSSQMGAMMQSVCLTLGGTAMTAQHRDWILQTILGSYGKSNTSQLAWMVLGVCHSLGGSDISAANLKALLVQILAAPIIDNPVQLGAILHLLLLDLGGGTISALHSEVLVTGIRAAGRVDRVKSALAMIHGGENDLAILQLDAPPVTGSKELLPC